MQKGPHMKRLLHRTIRDSLRVHASPSQSADVHFHQGPQGQPTPCFDEGCPNPRLSVS
jgi:hypothetical protein